MPRCGVRTGERGDVACRPLSRRSDAARGGEHSEGARASGEVEGEGEGEEDRLIARASMGGVVDSCLERVRGWRRTWMARARALSAAAESRVVRSSDTNSVGGMDTHRRVVCADGNALERKPEERRAGDPDLEQVSRRYS